MCKSQKHVEIINAPCYPDPDLGACTIEVKLFCDYCNEYFTEKIHFGNYQEYSIFLDKYEKDGSARY